MDCYPQEDEKNDVVFNVHWTCSGTNGTYNGSAYGSVGLSLNLSKPYTPYAELTQDQVINWVQEALGIDACVDLQLNIDNQIENQINPKIITPPLPWSNI